MKCPKCQTEIESGFDACWRCGYSISGGNTIERQEETFDDILPCLRCGTALDFAGNFNFHEGTRWGTFGGLFELLVNKESFDIYACPQCGKAEFYISKS